VVYQAERAKNQASLPELVRTGRLQISRNVWFLGLTSLFTDISSEMVASILPAYLVLQLGVSPLVFGTIDGLYQGVGSLVRWIGGAAADRSRRHKEFATAGYALSALTRLGLLVVGNAWTAIVALVALDRIGKGFRTAPRDVLISLSARQNDLGTAFGVHRAMDAFGALLGPITAFVILALSPRAFDVVFVVSFSVAVIGVGCIVLFVENVPVAPVAPEHASLTAPFRHPQFVATLAIACVLAVATMSDAFVYLLLQRSANFGAQYFPLLAAGTAVAYVTLAVPAGWAADRVGRPLVFVAGHLALLGVYAMLWLSSGGVAVAVVCVLLLGNYYAMTDGVLAAAASAILPPQVRGNGLALLATGVSLSRLTASIVFGWTWSRYGTATAVTAFAVALAVGITAAFVSRRVFAASQP
jgi:MFS family permease